MVFNMSIFQNTVETRLKRAGHGGYAKLKKKEMCQFALDMSLVTHCKLLNQRNG